MSDTTRSSFNTQLTSVMESLLTAAVCEITKIFEGSLSNSQMEIAQSREEVKSLKLQLEALERRLREVSESERTEKRMGQTLDPSSLVKSADANSDPGSEDNGPLLQPDALTWRGDSTIGEGYEQPCMVKDEVEVTELECVSFTQGGAEVVSIVLKEEVGESSPGVQRLMAPLPAAEQVNSQGAQKEGFLCRRVKPRPGRNPELLVGLLTERPRCAPTQPGLLRPTHSVNGFNVLGPSGNRQDGPQVEFRDVQGCENAVGEGTRCTAQTSQVNNIGRGHATLESSCFHPLPDSADGGVTDLYRCCPESVLRNSEANLSMDFSKLPCTVAQAKTTVPNNLQSQALLPHCEETLHSCSLCARAFVSPSQLKLHMQSHTGDKPYPCAQCSKSFVSPSHLNVHMRVHTGERPYCCTQCGKRFAHNGNLRAHQRQVHLGKRPFPCTECGKRFTKRGNLRTHQQQVHLGKRPFTCMECGKAYFSLRDLRSHQRVHTVE
ncbi:zinc finger protein with KRAB and SCAN domains 2-like [Megalops cyprinoides]|uniref:zinc finger protein with KRAB and SCAN domains 2-like n=1 Tax=Megalops cyprinoides TaxID=118141 RepID=UPI0018640FE8|nr:zinc finger protein with KRAB and SCAN domains 2-like [Megalops cyprinoides]